MTSLFASTQNSLETTVPRPDMFDDFHIENATIFDVTTEFIETFVLQKPGDFCVSQTLKGQLFLSMLAESAKDGDRIVHLQVRAYDDGYGFRGMLFARGKTLGQLIFQLHENIDILCGVLEKQLRFAHMMTASSIEVHNIHFEKKVEKVKVIDRSLHFTKYTGEMKFADGRVKEAMFEEAKNVDNEYMEKFFSKMVTVAALIEKHLPVRLPIAAFISPPTLIYDLQKENSGFPLSYILKHHDNLLDLTQRVKLCSSAVRVMSELHQADIFHGALIAKNFFLNFIRINDGVKEYELVFNGPSGLLFLGKSDCSVSLIDYDLNAPELAFTRKLTKESGVFNIGRLFEQILKTEILKTYQKNAPEDPPALREMRQMIARATRPNPYHRPTTNGIVMMIRETLKILPPSSAPVNFVHYDQFAI